MITTQQKNIVLVPPKEDVFEFTENGHSYTLNGVKLTGVTTVLGVISKGDGLIQWAANMAVEYVINKLASSANQSEALLNLDTWLIEAKTAHRRVKEDAGDKGKDLHAIIEMIIGTAIMESKGVISKKWAKAVEMLVETPTKREQLTNFLDWAKDKKFLESEKRTFSKELWLAGTVDFVYESNGEVYVGDVKTAKTIYPTNFWQTSAYQFMLQERGLYPKIKGFTIVRLGKDGGFEVKDNFSYEDNIEGFKSALTIYRKLNLITPKKTYKRKVTTK